MYNRLDSIPTCDRQTDRRLGGQTDRQTFCHGTVRAMHTRRAVKMTQVQYFFRIKHKHGSDIPCDLVILTFNLGGHGACRLCGSMSSIPTPTLKFLGLTARKTWHILCDCVSRPVTLTFNLLTLKLMLNVARVMGYPPANFGDTTTIRFRFIFGSD